MFEKLPTMLGMAIFAISVVGLLAAGFGLVYPPAVEIAAGLAGAGIAARWA